MRQLAPPVACLLTSASLLGAPGPVAAPTPQATMLPIEYFTRPDAIHGITISPSGEHVAYMTGKDGRSMIAVLSLKDQQVTGGVKCPDNFEVYDFRWVSGSRLIYRIAQRQPGLAKPTVTGEILAMDVDGGRQALIYGYRAGDRPSATLLPGHEASYATADLISTFRADEKNILIAEHPWLHRTTGWYYDPDAKPTIYRLDIFSGRKERLDTAPLANARVLVDRDDHVRFAIGKDERFKLAVSWKPDPTSGWTAFEFPGFREESITPRVFESDDQSVLFTGAREGETHTALFRLDLKSKEITKVFAFDNASIGRVILDFSGTRIVAVAGYTDRQIYHWLANDDPAARIYQALQRAFRDQEVFVTSTSRDGRLAVVLVGSDVNPGEFYLFDTHSMKAEYLQAVRPWVDPAKMRPKTPFTMKARDGLELHGYVTRPDGEGPSPLVVLPHGGPEGVRDTWSYDWDVQLLASRGYAVLQLNFRGSGGYGIDFANAGLREWGARMQDDITDATRWAIEQKIGAADRTCIFGASFGGYAALMGVVREPKLYRCAIGYAGVYDLELLLKSGDIARSRTGQAFLESALGSDREELASRSPANNAQKIEVPVLLIHGKEDMRADFAQAKRMKSALESAAKRFEWVALSYEGHGVYDEQTRREVYEKILGFLERNLAPVTAARTQ